MFRDDKEFRDCAKLHVDSSHKYIRSIQYTIKESKIECDKEKGGGEGRGDHTGARTREYTRL